MGQETNCKNKYLKANTQWDRLNVYLMCWVPNSEKNHRCWGREKGKVCNCCQGGVKDQGLVPNQLPSEGKDGAAQNSCQDLGGGQIKKTGKSFGRPILVS